MGEAATFAARNVRHAVAHGPTQPRNAESFQSVFPCKERRDMRLFLKKTPGWFGSDTAETIIGVVSGLIVLCIITARIWESLPG
jgi:hypothetical protein